MPKKAVAQVRRVRSPKVVRARVPSKVMRKANRRRPASSLEKDVHSILKEEKIPFVKEKTIGRCHADIFIEPKTVIELNGCYWHGCRLCTKTYSKMQLNALAKDA